MDFVHLHCHTEGSFLDGMCRARELARGAADFGMGHVAITDHGAMYNVVQFDQQCRAAGVKPIIGCEIYVSPGPRQGRQRVNGDAAFHMLALCKNETGYRNLIQLVSKGYTEGFYTKPRVDHELLQQHSEGLIVTSSCLSGELSRLVLRGELQEARRRAAMLKEIFGPENYYIELQRHGLPEEDRAAEELVRIAHELNLSLVCTNDVHYLRREHADAHEVLLCIQTNTNLSDEKRMRYGPPHFYLRSPEEMAELFKDVPEAIENTVRIARQCDFTFDYSQVHLPHFEAPEGYTPETWLERLCRERIPELYPEHTQELEDRLKYELGVIHQKGYSSYFLIVHDFVRFARGRGIMSQARGSAAGSLVSYLLGLTTIDPLRYRLMFERFLNPERQSMPDIDLDFADDRRDEVIQYCRDRYGADHVAQIVAFGTMAARAAVRDSARVLEWDPKLTDRIIKMIPETPGTKLDALLAGKGELARQYESDGESRKLIDTARQVEGLFRHRSVHAAGVVITDEPTTHYAPVCTLRDGEDSTVLQYGMADAEKIGLVKMDFLGLRNLTVVDRCIRLLRERRGVEIDLRQVPLDDPATYELLQAGRGVGVFQLESPGMRRLLKQVRPDRLEDLISVVAIFRPGPLQNGYDALYVRRKHGHEPVVYLHPALEPILDYSYGVILFQEQVMKITQVLAGFTPGDAEKTMKAMSKKKADDMAQLEPRFIEGASERGLTRKAAKDVFDQLASFAQYGFGLNHSAAYALLSYHTAYLKANFPHEFMACNLTSIKDNKEKLALYISDVNSLGIALRPPCINLSGVDFTVEDEDDAAVAIRFGLDAIKSVGAAVVRAVVAARTSGGRAFNSLWDFTERLVDELGGTLPRSALDGLIRAGALDSLAQNRAQLLAAAEPALGHALAVHRSRAGGQLDIFGGQPEQAHHTLPRVPPLGRDELLRQERELLGVFLSDSPLRGNEGRLRSACTHLASDLEELKDEADVTVGGVVWSVVENRTRQDRIRIQAELLDPTGFVRIVFFPRGDDRPLTADQVGRLVVVKGRAQLREVQGEEGTGGAEVEIRGRSVQPLSAEPPVAARTLNVSLKKGRRVDIETLRRLLASHPGRDLVQFHVDQGEVVGKVLAGVTVAITDGLLADANRLAGRVGGAAWIE